MHFKSILNVSYFYSIKIVTISCPVKKKKTEELFPALHRFAAFIPIQPLMAVTPRAGCRTFFCLRSKSQALCSRRGRAELTFVLWLALPAYASNGGTVLHPHTMPWALDLKAATYTPQRCLIHPARTRRSPFEFHLF